MSVHHIAFYVPESQLGDEVKFLEAALGHSGFKEIMRPVATLVGMGTTSPQYWVKALPDKEMESYVRPHIAFTASSKEEVDTFHEAGVKAGGKDNGAAGPRPHFGPTYYAAFVISPAGYNIEVVYNGN